MKAAFVSFASAVIFQSSAIGADSLETQAQTLVTDTVKKLHSVDYPEVWKSFSAKSRNKLRLSMLNHLQLQKELGEKRPKEAAVPENAGPTPFEKLQMENDSEFRKEAEIREKAVKDPAGNYISHMLHQWGFETNLEDTGKLSNEQFWKIFVEHMEDLAGNSNRPLLAKDKRLELWDKSTNDDGTLQITSTKIEQESFTVETTIPGNDYFHGNYASLFLLFVPRNPEEKPKDRFPFTWSGTIQGGKLELDVPPPVLENFRKWNEGLNRRLIDP